MLYGDAQQAEAGKLSGRVVLDSPEPIDISSIKLELVGRYKTLYVIVDPYS